MISRLEIQECETKIPLGKNRCAIMYLEKTIPQPLPIVLVPFFFLVQLLLSLGTAFIIELQFKRERGVH